MWNTIKRKRGENKVIHTNIKINHNIELISHPVTVADNSINSLQVKAQNVIKITLMCHTNHQTRKITLVLSQDPLKMSIKVMLQKHSTN